MSGLVDVCVQHGVKILAYGVLAGGFLTDTWLGAVKPSKEVGECQELITNVCRMGENAYQMCVCSVL